MNPITNLAELEDALSEPTPGVLDTLRQIDGDILVLGAGGKMGPTLARMARRGCDALGQDKRRVIAVSRYSSPAAADELRRCGVETVACDLLDRAAVQKLPDAPNVIYMAGQKFGTSDAPELTWAMNTVVPAIAAERYPNARTVVFSTGCVYPLSSVTGPGVDEDTPLTPLGEYPNSCVGRERVYGHYARLNGTPALYYRLSYAIDLRYGVLLDVALKVARGEPVDVTMGEANVIWQGEANARAIQCLEHTSSPPVALNVTGQDRVKIRSLAQRFGELLERPAQIVGEENSSVWVLDARRSYDWFGAPTVTLEEMITATADWVRKGGVTINKPTHFEVRDGQF